MFIFVDKNRTKKISYYLIKYTFIRLIIILEYCYEYFLLEIIYISLIKNTLFFQNQSQSEQYYFLTKMV